MAKKASQFIFRKDYEKWLLKQGVKSVGAYCPQDKYKCNGKDYLYLDLIGVFAIENERLYVNALFEEWKAFIENKNQNNLKTVLNRLSYLQKYRQFVETIVYGKKRLSKEDNEILNEIRNALSSVRNSINNSQNPKVDGMDSLIEYISTKQFIKLAIESSYFFSPKLVKERVDEIKDYINMHKKVDPAFSAGNYKVKYLPARYSEANGGHERDESAGEVYFKLPNASQRLCVIYQEGARGKNKECGGNTCGGGNGNARVCQLIKDRTGYDLGTTTNKKHFRNFIISHIWGHAIDPRYFTNLWNIVIVPAWANHLLDKDEKGTLASTFKATIQKIITELYDFNNINWASIQMTPPSYNNKEVISGRYQINIIDHKSGNAPLGKIWKKPVSI
jgi:hypothetical protein